MFSQEGVPQTHQSVLEIPRNTGIHRSSVGRIIPWPFQSHPPRGKQRTYSLANTFLGTVAIERRLGGKLCMRLEAMLFRIACSKNEHRFKLF